MVMLVEAMVMVVTIIIVLVPWVLPNQHQHHFMSNPTCETVKVTRKRETEEVTPEEEFM